MSTPDSRFLGAHLGPHYMTPFRAIVTIVALSTIRILVPCETAPAAIYEWEWVDPDDPAQGRRESHVLVPDGQNRAQPGWNFHGNDLTKAYLIGTDLAWADLGSAILIDADLTGAHLIHVELDGATLTGTSFTRAEIANADFSDTTSRGITAAQLYSTNTYIYGGLNHIRFSSNDLSAWSFAGTTMHHASFKEADLSHADLRGAALVYSSFTSATLTGADLSNANLTHAYLQSSVLAGANLTGARILSTDFTNTTSRGFGAQQLYSTASYGQADLHKLQLSQNDLTGWDFPNQNLGYADFTSSTLRDANLALSNIRWANFTDTTSRGFSVVQLQSTASYERGDLRGIQFGGNDMSGWRLAGQDLTNAGFESVDLHSADFTGANLTGANLHSALLANARLDHAEIQGANLSNTTAGGLTARQIYGSASYRPGDLTGVDLRENDLSNWSFTGQD